MTIVYIGLGSNLSSNFQSPEQHITAAIQSLGEIQSTRMMNVSSLYKSKPVGPQDQDDYINAVAQIETELNPHELLNRLQAIENEHDRVRNERWGPRTLDLDILLFGKEIIHDDYLTIPHAEMVNRSFVLIPLAEINSDCVIPEKGAISDLLSGMTHDDLQVLQ
jgi:2-amino-4-hydroxy-6-hydroxymethyldihydropteridine diphosphokinase